MNPAPKPDFSPAMLRLFLNGRAVHRHGGMGVPLAQAREALVSELHGICGLSKTCIRQALSGALKDGAQREVLWTAVDFPPAHIGVTLTDDGGQVKHHASDAPTQHAPDVLRKSRAGRQPERDGEKANTSRALKHDERA